MPEQKRRTAKAFAVLDDGAVNTALDVFSLVHELDRFCQTRVASEVALPEIVRCLFVPVSVDCVLALRVAAAEAAWKIGGRQDLALPFLAWALKDESVGVSRKAAEVLSDMGPVAHEAVPDLIRLAERRLDSGPLHYEIISHPENEKSLLTVLATAIGNCGQGARSADRAQWVLKSICSGDDADAATAARLAIEKLNHLPSQRYT